MVVCSTLDLHEFRISLHIEALWHLMPWTQLVCYQHTREITSDLIWIEIEYSGSQSQKFTLAAANYLNSVDTRTLFLRNVDRGPLKRTADYHGPLWTPVYTKNFGEILP